MRKIILLLLLTLLNATSCMKTITQTTAGCSSYYVDKIGQIIGYIFTAGSSGVELSTKNDCSHDPYHSSYHFVIDPQTAEINSSNPYFYTKTTTFDLSDVYVNIGGGGGASQLL